MQSLAKQLSGRGFPVWSSDDESIVLCNGDCLSVLPTLPRVDAVVTDPPYGVGMDAFDDNFAAGAGGFAACNAMRAAVFHSPRRMIEFCSQVSPWSFERALWMHKTADIAAPWRGWCMNSEVILIFSQCRKGWPIATDFRQDVYSVGPWERAGHPNGKPLVVVNDLVRRLSADGETILDPFTGSGTTGVACVRLGRKFIGIEKEPKYFEIAKRRIQDELSRNPLFEKPAQLKQRDLLETA